MSNNESKGLSWEPLEPLFQVLLPVLFGERNAESVEEEAALKKIHLALVAAASRIFRSPRFRGVDCDPHVAAQMWFIAIRGAKQRYDPHRPFHKYAYPVLGWICCDLCRRERVRRVKTITPDIADWSPAPWQLAAWREQRHRVRRALRTLKLSGKMSRKQRTAIALKGYRGLSSREAGELCGVSRAIGSRT